MYQASYLWQSKLFMKIVRPTIDRDSNIEKGFIREDFEEYREDLEEYLDSMMNEYIANMDYQSNYDY